MVLGIPQLSCGKCPNFGDDTPLVIILHCDHRTGRTTPASLIHKNVNLGKLGFHATTAQPIGASANILCVRIHQRNQLRAPVGVLARATDRVRVTRTGAFLAFLMDREDARAKGELVRPSL